MDKAQAPDTTRPQPEAGTASRRAVPAVPNKEAVAEIARVLGEILTALEKAYLPDFEFEARLLYSIMLTTAGGSVIVEPGRSFVEIARGELRAPAPVEPGARLVAYDGDGTVWFEPEPKLG